MLVYYKELGPNFPVYYKQGTSGTTEHHFISSPLFTILTLWFSILLRVYYKSSLTSTVRNFSLIYLFILFYF
jgi:hypothetical protein